MNMKCYSECCNARLNIQSTTLPASVFTFSSVQTIYIHPNGKGHFVTPSALTNKIKIYDSLNAQPTTLQQKCLNKQQQFILVILQYLEFSKLPCQFAKVEV